MIFKKQKAFQQETFGRTQALALMLMKVLFRLDQSPGAAFVYVTSLACTTQEGKEPQSNS